MKKTMLALAACSVAGGCSSEPPGDAPVADSIGQTQQALDFKGTKSLTLLQGGLETVTDPGQRTANTDQYYNTVTVGSGLNGAGTTIAATLPTLQDFINFYEFDAGRTTGFPARSVLVAPPEVAGVYYNRGDLGIGREMHCVDNVTTSELISAQQAIACYVKNYAAGDAGEFQFGLSSNDAMINLYGRNAFATVAMVFRNNVPDPNKVFFVVYGSDGTGAKLQNFAALDRAGALGAVAHDLGPGVPGTNYNNHVPTNCINCHGGSYDPGFLAASNSFFLPFDTEQFDFAGDQADTFKTLNQLVWRVDTLNNTRPNPTGTTSHPVAEQLDAWYMNTSHQVPPAPEVFENNFDKTQVVGDWGSQAPFYNSVLRTSCRNCHMANPTYPFNRQGQFSQLASDKSATGMVSEICNHQMPDSLQTLRLFWQSSEPTQMENYLRTTLGNAERADAFHLCGPGNVATLDPPEIAASLALFR